jgi:hypothetical protein
VNGRPADSTRSPAASAADNQTARRSLFMDCRRGA